METGQMNSEEVCQSSEGESQIFQKLVIYEQYIENPNQQRNSFFQQFFKTYQIATIAISSDYLQIRIVKRRKKQKVPQKEVKQQSCQYEDPKLQQSVMEMKKGIQGGFSKLSSLFSKQASLENKKAEEFQKYLKSHSGSRNFWGAYIEPNNESIVTKTIAFSRKMIQMLGYELQEAALCFRRYRQVAFNYICNRAYRQIILFYMKVLHQLSCLTEEHINDPTIIKQVLNTNFSTFQNQMIGKNSVKINTVVTFRFISLSVLEFSIDQVLSVEQLDMEPNYKKKSIVEEQFHKRIYHSLSSIYKLPKTINPDNKMKICSYIQINPKKASEKISQNS